MSGRTDETDPDLVGGNVLTAIDRRYRRSDLGPAVFSSRRQIPRVAEFLREERALFLIQS